MSDVSLAGAFLAGLVSFLSPCVLPLVPGYISMLSGIGMEQLRKGELPKSGLFATLRIVWIFTGFCGGIFRGVYFFRGVGERGWVVFAPKPGRSGAHCGRTDFAFWASSFGITDQAHVKNRTYHRHGTGCSRDCLVVAPWAAFCGLWRDPLFFVVADRFFWAGDGALAKSRCAYPKQNRAAWRMERVFVGIRFRIRLDALHRANSCNGFGACGGQRHDCAGDFTFSGLFRGTGGTFSTYRAGHRAVSALLSKFSQIPACGRSF